MKKYMEMTRQERQAEYAAVKAAYDAQKAMGLQLNMARGKPGKEQLKLVMEMGTILQTEEDYIDDGLDSRNYGTVDGMPAARRLFADILGCRPEQCFVGGNASLQLMFDTISKAYVNGLLHSEKPWSRLEKVKWICPVPGYDRHFKVTENFGFEMISVPMTATGPDMDMVEELIRDPAVKGMWNVPKYSNPTGIVYSDETIQRLASMKPAAPDFMLIWDNAYCIHEFACEFRPFGDILSLCEKYGNADMIYEYASTSKITFPGAGVSVMATSEANLAYLNPLINIRIISYDKINQMRHVKYFHDADGIRAHMRRHAEILRPKFETVLSVFERELGGTGIAEWTHPRGGYFISLNTMDDCARRVYKMAKSIGVALTEAGATFPYGCDPRDRNLRIAPSYPAAEELENATHVVCQCIRFVSAETLLSRM